MTIKGTITGAALPPRLVNEGLQAAVDAAAGCPVGLAVLWDADNRPVEVRYEFDADAGASEDAVRAAVLAYRLADEVPDDFEAAATANAAKADLETRVATLEGRVAALEALLNV